MDGLNLLSRGSLEVQTSQWQPMVGTPILVPEPSTVMRSGTLENDIYFFLLSSTAWMYRNRSSVREFSSSRCSSIDRLPLVLSSNTFIISILCLARSRSGSGFSASSPKWNNPSCISACARSDRMRKSKVAGGRPWRPSVSPTSEFSCSLICSPVYLKAIVGGWLISCQKDSRNANCNCLGVLTVLRDLPKSGFPSDTVGSDSVGVLVTLNVSQR